MPYCAQGLCYKIKTGTCVINFLIFAIWMFLMSEWINVTCMFTCGSSISYIILLQHGWSSWMDGLTLHVCLHVVANLLFCNVEDPFLMDGSTLCILMDFQCKLQVFISLCGWFLNWVQDGTLSLTLIDSFMQNWTLFVTLCFLVVNVVHVQNMKDCSYKIVFCDVVGEDWHSLFQGGGMSRYV